ncbi:MAG: hypothetical protein FWC68_04085 [Oscillospiraceae bacterium]|nr:hypothetical protein [Oscillospiraceae bacterium]
MKLQLIYGKAGSGKTEYILNDISEKINLGKKIYVIVPEQFSYGSEKRLLQAMGETAVINAEVVSFNQIAHRMQVEVRRKSKNAFIRKWTSYVSI